jgi:hypothetical protein
MDTRTPIHDALNAIEHPFDAFHRHHNDPVRATQETHNMAASSVLSNVKAVIESLEHNQLIGAIVDRNLGTMLTPAEVNAVANFIRELEDAKRPQDVSRPPANTMPPAPGPQPALA